MFQQPTPPSTLMPSITKPILGAVTGGKHPWTGGKLDPGFMATTQTIPRSAHCYHLQDPSEAHKQLKTKTMIPLTNDSMTTKKFSHDEKEIMVEELAEVVVDFVEFHGMHSEIYLPDPQNASKLCFMNILSILQVGL